MQMTVVKIIGTTRITFMVEGDSLWECQEQAQKLSFPDVPECGLCKSESLYLFSYLAQGKYRYTKIICKNCKGSIQFTNRVDDPKTIFLKKNEEGRPDWQKYVKKQPEKTPPPVDTPPPPEDPPPIEKEDDMPF